MGVTFVSASSQVSIISSASTISAMRLSYLLFFLLLSTGLSIAYAGVSIEEYDSIELNASENEYDSIDPDISEDELMKMLEDMGYDDNTIDDLSGISDLLDLIAADNTEEHLVDYDYKIFGGEAFIGDDIANTDADNLLYPDIDYQDKLFDVEATESNSEETDDAQKNNSDEDESEIVWVPAAVVQYDYEIVDVQEALDIFDDADTQLDYQEDQNYKMFVQKALDSSVKFENIYEEQRIFNIILLSGISLICLIVMFGLISLAISMFSRLHPNNPTRPDRNVKLVKTEGIVKSYAKLPVEMKNILPSNVA